MAIVSSFGTLTAIANPGDVVSTVSTAGPYYDGYSRTYADIYRSQPAVRTVVDFFARNIAQLGLQVFRRQSDTDRQRLTDHPLAQTLKNPNPGTSRFRFVESTVQDIGTYANGYWLKVRAPRRLGLVRIPAGEMFVHGGLIPTGFEWRPSSGARPVPFAPSEIVHFPMYDPANPLVGYPPIETLRRVLAEAAASGEYREQFWKNSGRFESVIERPAGPKWDPERRNEFRNQWQEFAGARAGRTPILEDGMQLKQVSFNARDSQYVESVKLTREVVAAQYHVPLPMVGILDHATFSNIREQHKQLYQDCLGPWLVMLEEEMERQLLPEFEDVDEVYLEFNIAEKLKGSFDEQTTSLSRAIGRPYMTVNEGRARLNLPRDPDPKSDRIAETSPGQGQSFSPDSAPANGAAVAVMEKYAARQIARIDKYPADARHAHFDRDRWRRELAADLSALLPVATADAIADVVTAETVGRLQDGLLMWTRARLDAVARRIAEEGARG